MGKRRVSHYYFHNADDQYVRDFNYVRENPFDKFKYSQPETFPKPLKYEKDDVPIAFRATPESLLDMTIKIIQMWELPSVYNWSIERVCQWIREYGYPEYQNIFRGNMINGRTLLLVDASALPAMNIKNFDHIRHITHGIRCLYHYEVTRFAHSISLPPEHYIELYKLLRVKNGAKYEHSKIAELWRRMKLIPPPKYPRDHWEMLERSLGQFEQEQIRIGCITPIYSAKRMAVFVEQQIRRRMSCGSPDDCNYMDPNIEAQDRAACVCCPPCECFWTEQYLRKPWKLDAVEGQPELTRTTNGVLSILTKMYPARYCPKPKTII